VAPVAKPVGTGTVDAGWIGDLLNADMSVASPDERKKATDMADQLSAPVRPASTAVLDVSPKVRRIFEQHQYGRAR